MQLAQLGIKPIKIKQFNKKGIFTAEDLVRFLPRKYNDFSKETKVLKDGEKACVLVTINEARNSAAGKGAPISLYCTVIATGKDIVLTWFNQYYRLDRLAELTSAVGVNYSDL